MRWLVCLVLLIPLAYADDPDESTVYGVVTWVSEDRQTLELDGLVVGLSGSEREGNITVGALVKVEGVWAGEGFRAFEVEVERSEVPLLYWGQVHRGRVLGIAVPDFPEGTWLELTAARGAEGQPLLLTESPLSAPRWGVAAPVEALTENGFVAGGVRVVSRREVVVGDEVTVVGRWDGQRLIEP